MAAIGSDMAFPQTYDVHPLSCPPLSSPVLQVTLGLKDVNLMRRLAESSEAPLPLVGAGVQGVCV